MSNKEFVNSFIKRVKEHPEQFTSDEFHWWHIATGVSNGVWIANGFWFVSFGGGAYKKIKLELNILDKIELWLAYKEWLSTTDENRVHSKYPFKWGEDDE